MTDNKIINQWKHERELAECVCSYFVDQVELSLVNETIDLINRQKAEIEKLKSENEILSLNADNAFQEGLNECRELFEPEIKSEAYKEFADRLKMNITINNTNDGYLDYSVDYHCLMEDIDDLVKEMVGDKK